MSALFVSDCHLSPERPHIMDCFAGFLQGRARRAEQLFILGDLFDYWIGDDDPAEEFADVFRALAALGARIPVWFIAGNRDFMAGAQFARRTGCRLLPDTHVFNADRPTLLMHGDLLCTADTGYLRYRRIVRHPLTMAAARRLRLNWRRRIALSLRRNSRRAMAGKSEAVMDVEQRTVAAYMRRFSVRRLIHGHTHRPAIHDFTLDGEPAQRIVLGDWYEQGSVLELDNGRLRLHAPD